MKYRKLIGLLAGMCAASSFAAEKIITDTDNHKVMLQSQTGFFRFSYDNIKMPQHIQRMGLLGINYYSDFTPDIYGGIGAYGAVTGTQGGLFTLGVGAGVHHQFAERWWGDIGMYVGGGGGRASLVGGGLMLRPSAGVEYDFKWARLGLHYSYIDFPNGEIRGQSIGLDLDVPYEFYYVKYKDVGSRLINFSDIQLFKGKYLNVQRNDFGILVQAYKQKHGTKGVGGTVQDGTMGLVGAELDHYLTEKIFWSLKASGAFTGVPNGYMDVLGGLGYHWSLGSYGFALVPQFNAGVGGGGNVDTGGGVLLQPQLGVEWPITSSFSGRLSGGYLWAPQGQLSAATVTGEVFYHLDMAAAGAKSIMNSATNFKAEGWRIQLFNQTYIHPQRVNEATTSPDNMVGVQIDQMFTPHFFLTYQAASAYAGVHAGGFATGMIGPGVQTSELLKSRVQPFAEVLIGAGGGGGLKIGGGAIIEPVVGVHFLLTPSVGLEASVGQVIALRDKLTTPVFNLGITTRFGTLTRDN